MAVFWFHNGVLDYTLAWYITRLRILVIERAFLLQVAVNKITFFNKVAVSITVSSFLSFLYSHLSLNIISFIGLSDILTITKFHSKSSKGKIIPFFSLILNHGSAIHGQMRSWLANFYLNCGYARPILIYHNVYQPIRDIYTLQIVWNLNIEWKLKQQNQS